MWLQHRERGEGRWVMGLEPTQDLTGEWTVGGEADAGVQARGAGGLTWEMGGDMKLVSNSG